MNYVVHLTFKRGPGMSMTVQAESEQAAIERVKREAVGYGFDEPVKKQNAVPVNH